MKTYKFTMTYEDVFFYEVTAENEDAARERLIELDRDEATGRSSCFIESQLQGVEDPYYAREEAE